MPQKNISIAVIVVVVIITITLSLLGAAGIIGYSVYAEQGRAELRSFNLVLTEQAKTALTIPLWNFDREQILQAAESVMKERSVYAVVVKQAGTESVILALVRDSEWKAVETDTEILSAKLPGEQADITFSREVIGSVQVFVTPRFLEDRLASARIAIISFICVVAILLTTALYSLLWRIVLKPVKRLEQYALRVSKGDVGKPHPALPPFFGELETLRTSITTMITLLESRYVDLQEETRRTRESEKRFRTLVDTIPDLIWLQDAEGVYLSCNKMFERLLGAEEADIIGKTDYDFVDREQADSFRQHDRKVMASGTPSTNEEWLTFVVDGHGAWMETVKVPTYDTEGVLVGVLGIARDISERKRAEEEKAKLQDQLIQSQKMESVGRLAGGVAHDFNNMLGVIIGYADMALRSVDETQPLHASLAEIRKAAQRSADLTRQLLAFARKQTVVPKVLDLNQTVEGMLRMLQRLIGEDIQLSWRPEAGLWLVKIDPSQIDQILANLCVNARDAIANVGKVTIETANSTLDEAYCTGNVGFEPGDYVRLTVSDNGCGMDKETLAHIFEPFFTSKRLGEGTGLGLATVYGAVRQNDGFINVYSEPGCGTTFTIYLPRHLGEMVPIRTDDAQEPLLRGAETILLVEDEAAILNMTRTMLEIQGYTVLAARTPNEALRLGKDHAEEIRLLMTDVIMPEMNGSDLAKNLLSLCPHLKCLFMSGYTANVIVHHGVLDKGICFIQKPFSMQDLAVKVRDTLDARA